MPRAYTRLPMWSKVLPKIEFGRIDDCWPWTGGQDEDGYGLFGHDGKTYRMARLMFEFCFAPLEPGELVRHSCDNPPCLNPAHLLKGTHGDNMRDRGERGRQVRGQRHHAAKITEADVRLIRSLAAEGVTHYALAERFGLARAHVGLIVQRKRWAFVT